MNLRAGWAFRSRCIVLAATAMASEAGRWDIAFSSGAFGADQYRLVPASDPYYFWPVFVVVADDGSVTSLGDLAGRTVCVVAGSAGEAWLDGRLDGWPVQVREPAPSGVDIRREPDDAACMEAVTDGTAAGAVTVRRSPRPTSRCGLASRAWVGRCSPRHGRSSRANRAPRPTRSSRRSDGLLGDMRADGTLSDMSRRQFGGADLSTAITE